MKYSVTLNGNTFEVEVEALNGTAAVVSSAAPAAPTAAPAVSSASGEQVVSPMPGTILKVNVSANQAVKAGEVLFVLEAMKMENDIVAPKDGTVVSVAVSKGSTVSTDQTLAVIG